MINYEHMNRLRGSKS